MESGARVQERVVRTFVRRIRIVKHDGGTFTLT